MIKYLKTITYPDGEVSIANFGEYIKRISITHTIEWSPSRDYALELIFILRISKELQDNGVHKFTIKADYLPWQREDKTENGRVDMRGIYELLQKNFSDEVKIEVPILHPSGWEGKPEKISFYNDYQNLMNDRFWVNLDFINEVDQEKVVLVFPDKSAFERNKIFLLNEGWQYITCDKHRDKVTGKITKMDLCKELSSISLNSEYTYRFLVVDDICSKGSTFIGALKVLSTYFPDLKFSNENTMLWTYYDEGQKDKKWNFPHVFIKPLDFH